MNLYDISLRHGLVLAPMSGYTNWPMRALSRRFGAELCYTEMISSAGLIKSTKNTLPLLDRPMEDAPLIAQIFTASPDDAGLSARIIQDQGFDGIDINMGCPVKKVVHKGAGSALMKDISLAQRITESVVQAVSIPVSVKIRAGWDSGSLNALAMADSLEKTGIACITLHPRTRAEMYLGTPRWEILSTLKAQLKLPVVASGNIKTVQDLENLRCLGADAFMIGRGAVGNPWIFRELSGGPGPEAVERIEILLEHLDMLCSVLGDQRGSRFMKKYLSAYVKGLPGAALFRQQACTAENALKLRSIIKEFSNSW